MELVTVALGLLGCGCGFLAKGCSLVLGRVMGLGFKLKWGVSWAGCGAISNVCLLRHSTKRVYCLVLPLAFKEHRHRTFKTIEKKIQINIKNVTYVYIS